MTIKEKFDDIIMRIAMPRIIKRAKRMYERYGEVKLEYFGKLTAKNGEKMEVYELPSEFHNLWLPDNFREFENGAEFDAKTRNLICLINAISAEVKHKPHYCERYDHLWRLYW